MPRGNAGETAVSSALFAAPPRDSQPSDGPASPLPEAEDQDSGDLPRGVDEDALEDDDLDTDAVTSPD